MCTGRVDLAFVLRALRGRADGVIVAGCWPGECHYVTEGNYDALGNLLLARKLLALVGVDPERLRLEWIAASEGSRFAEVMSAFAARIRALGPIAGGAGDGARALEQKLDALARLVPYLKLVEREKLRVQPKTEEAYRAFYESAEAERVVRDLIGGELAISRILLLLEEGPLSAGQLSERLGLPASDISRHVIDISRRGLVRYDLGRRRFALARATPPQPTLSAGDRARDGIDETIDAIIDRHGGDPSSLIQILLDIQGELRWLPEEALEKVAGRLGVPRARVQHIVTFYKAFSLVPKGRHEIHVCMGTACHVRGAPRILGSLRDLTGLGPGETDADLRFSLETVNCLGCCALGPVVEVDGRAHGKVSSARAADVLKGCE